jgi:Flp pilus assembly pilin Flp
MRRPSRKAAGHQRRESGQDLAEYALLIGLIALVVIMAVSTLGRRVRNVYWRINWWFWWLRWRLWRRQKPEPTPVPYPYPPEDDGEPLGHGPPIDGHIRPASTVLAWRVFGTSPVA